MSLDLEKSSDENLEDLTHDELCEVTIGTLTRLLQDDQFLADLPIGVTNEEVQAQIALAQGQSITVEVLRFQEPSLFVVVPQKNCTVLDLKKAIKRAFELRQKRNKSRGKISWKYIWRTYWLKHKDKIFFKDNEQISYYDVVNKSQISFIKKTKKLKLYS